MYDYLIVGSGLYGSVFAQMAKAAGKSVLVVDKRPNVGGNIYTEKIEGINVHKYGAHIFHTNDKKVWEYITRFAEFNRFTNSPVANYKGELYSLPFNMYTFNKMWGVVTPEEAEAKINEQRSEIKGEPGNLEEQAVSLVGRDIFEKLVKDKYYDMDKVIETALEKSENELKLKRILLVSHEMTYTGAPNSLLNIAVLLRSKGNYVKVATLKSGEFEKEFRKRGFWVRHFDEEKYEYDKLAKKQDLVIANTIFCGKFALYSQKYVPTILYIREAQNIPELIHNCGLSEEYITKAEHIICVSEYAEEFIRKEYSVNKLYVLHNFLRNELFYKPKPNVVVDGTIRFLIAGTLEERKGIDVALKAIELLPAELSDKTELHIAGRKVLWADEYQKSLKLEENKKVIYYGEINKSSEMSRLYDSVNVVIVPSYDESCSLTALEGAQHGKALIVSENVGAKYIVDNNGYVFKTGSAEDLSLAIREIIYNPKLLEEMGKASENNFHKYVSSKEYFQKFNRILSEIINKSKI